MTIPKITTEQATLCERNCVVVVALQNQIQSPLVVVGMVIETKPA